MPVYDCADAETIDAIWPSRVLDANGVEIEDVVWCDTDTGRVGCELRDAAGLPVLTADGKAVERVWADHPAPLRLERITPGEMETVAGV